MALIWKIWDRTLDLLAALSALVIAVMAAGISYDIVLRYMGVRRGAVWVFDFVEYGMLFVTCAMAAYIARAGRHVEVDLLLILLPPRGARVLRVFSAVAMTAISFTLFRYALRATLQSYDQGSFIFRVVLIPEWMPFAAIAAMFLSLGIEGLRRIWLALQRPEDGSGVPSEKAF